MFRDSHVNRAATAAVTHALRFSFACSELCAALPSNALSPADLLSAAEIRRSAGRQLIVRGQLEAAEVVLAQGLQHSAALRNMCIGSSGDSADSSAATPWGPWQEETAELLFGLLSERLRAALLLGQSPLAASLVEQARALVGEPRLPARVSAAFRLALVHILKMQGLVLLEVRSAV